MKTYDSHIAMENAGARKLSEFCGDVTSVRRGNPDTDGINRNDFELRRMWINSRHGIYIKLMPHEGANQEVGIGLSLHQARWLVGVLQEAITSAEFWMSKKDREREKNRERRQKKKAQLPPMPSQPEPA